MSKLVVTFGEVMGRLAPAGFKRIGQVLPGEIGFTFTGAEANVAVSVVRLGGQARFVSAVPTNAVGDACVDSIRSFGVDVDYIVRTDQGRLGLFFVETGANQRPGNVVYDRSGSSISLTAADDYRWDDALDDAAWLHLTGITPSISRVAAEATLLAAQTAKQRGIPVSCDLNFRKKMWRWDPSLQPGALAQKTMREILPSIDFVIANEEDAAVVLDIHAGATDVESGQLAIDKYPDVAREIVRQFGNVRRVGITLRESLSASHNNWGAMLYDAASDEAIFAPMHDGQYQPYEIRNIVDRVGAGDSFAAGLITCFTTDELNDAATAIQFATAASCLTHSFVGDFNLSSRQEVEALMGGASSGRVVR